MLIARRDADAPQPDGLAPLPGELIVPAVAGESWVVCKVCGNFVADGRAKISVNGSHAHSFINPSGVIFQVRCFAAAPGLRALGEASGHYTWFPGFEWQVGICSRCGAHLGWAYHHASQAFVALIADHVLERHGTGGPPASDT